MKRLLLIILSVLFGFLLCNATVHAEESDISYDDTLAQLLDASGVEDLLSEQGMDVKDANSLTQLSFQNVMSMLLQTLSASVAAPLRLLGLLLGVILIAALAQSMQGSRESVKSIYEMLCVLCTVGIIAKPISSVIAMTASCLEASAGFMLNFSVIFASILTVCGGLTTAVAYQTAILGACEIAMQVAVHILLPVLSMGLAMCIVDAVNPMISLDGMIKLLHKGTVWLLGLLMSLFLGLLSLQSMTGIASDKLASKTTKFVISNFIPFVGSAVSDAYSTVMGSMGILKTTTGAIGIFCVLSLFLPILVELILYRFLTALCGAVSDIFAIERLARLFKSMERILAAAFSVAVSFSLIFIVSTAILLLVSGNLITV